MRKNPTKKIEQYRTHGRPEWGAVGFFCVPHNAVELRIMASDGTDWEDGPFPLPAWEHVSVSTAARCPTWEEMDFVKRTFWRDDELVLQLHVPRQSHINCHPFCLHLWKPIGVDIPAPPLETVAPSEMAGR